MACLRGGISDLLEILVLEISDNQNFGSSVTNALTKLENQCYDELVHSKQEPYETEPFPIFYKIPEYVAQIAWNGTHLFYPGKDNKTIIKCVGDTKRADFGRELSTGSYDFKVTER